MSWAEAEYIKDNLVKTTTEASSHVIEVMKDNIDHLINDLNKRLKMITRNKRVFARSSHINGTIGISIFDMDIKSEKAKSGMVDCIRLKLNENNRGIITVEALIDNEEYKQDDLTLSYEIGGYESGDILIYPDVRFSNKISIRLISFDKSARYDVEGEVIYSLFKEG